MLVHEDMGLKTHYSDGMLFAISEVAFAGAGAAATVKFSYTK